VKSIPYFKKLLIYYLLTHLVESTNVDKKEDSFLILGQYIIKIVHNAVVHFQYFSHYSTKMYSYF